MLNEKSLLVLIAVAWMPAALACVVEEPSIVFGEAFAGGGADEGFVCKVVALSECSKDPILTLLSTSGEKLEIPPFKVENYAYTPTESLNYTRAAYFYKLEDIELDREYQWSIQATNQIGPFTFKHRDKDEYNRFDYFLVSNIDVSNKSLHLFKYLEATSWNQFDALILNGNAALNLQDSNGFVGDTFFKSLGPITSKVPFLIQAGPRDMVDEGRMLNYRFIIPGRSETFGNNLFHFNQGSSFMVFLNPNYYILLNDSDRSLFLIEMRRILERKKERDWLIAFLSGPYICYDGEPSCGANLYEIKAVVDLLSKFRVSLLIESQNGVYRKTITSTDLLTTSKVDYSPRALKYVNGLESMTQIVYGISGNAVQNLSKSANQWLSEDGKSSTNFTLPEESFMKISVHQLSIEVHLVDAKTNTTVDSIAIFRPSISLITDQQSSFVTFGLFILSPIILLGLLLLPRIFNLQTQQLTF